jgi:hypothetical protein
LHSQINVDPADFDRLVAGASNPDLIVGIYNYCDARCPKCAFTERCLIYVDAREIASHHESGDLVESKVDSGAPCHRTDRPPERRPLVERAWEYGRLAFRVSHAVLPIVKLRGDPPVIEAVETIEWFSSLIGSKLRRAVAGRAFAATCAGDIQVDFNGSAKMALIGIAESRQAWGILMEVGKATANGVPAQATVLLDALERDVRAEFPHAMAFVRPGFDEPDIIASSRPVIMPPVDL